MKNISLSDQDDIVSQRFYAECLKRFSHPDDVLHLVQKPEKMIEQLHLHSMSINLSCLYSCICILFRKLKYKFSFKKQL
jgi:hypothetical protein